MDNSDLEIDYPSLDWSELPPLNEDTLWAIIHESITDTQVNQILWHYLGYRYSQVENSWEVSQVAPEWLSVYPTPPDFIASRPATVKLTRSILPQHSNWGSRAINWVNLARVRPDGQRLLVGC
jgi:Domain of unknown function (DUF1823)